MLEAAVGGGERAVFMKRSVPHHGTSEHCRLGWGKILQKNVLQLHSLGREGIIVSGKLAVREPVGVALARRRGWQNSLALDGPSPCLRKRSGGYRRLSSTRVTTSTGGLVAAIEKYLRQRQMNEKRGERRLKLGDAFLYSGLRPSPDQFGH